MKEDKKPIQTLQDQIEKADKEKEFPHLNEQELLLKLDEVEDLLSNRVIEISISVNGTISTAPYENWKPGFFMKLDALGLTREQIRELYKQGKAELKFQFKMEKNNCKAEVISERFNNIGFTARDGLNYVWVSSVISYDIVWKIPEFELTQHGSRGTIGHEMAHDYVRKLMKIRKTVPGLKMEVAEYKKLVSKIEWMNPEKEEALQEHVAIVKNGSLDLHWDDLSVKAFLKEYGDHITEPEIEVTVWNLKHLYKGRADMFCLWDGVPTVVDYKCGSPTSDFRPLAAYAVCKEGTQQMIICQIGNTTNKTGYMKPKINTNIKGEFKAFVRKRQAFRKEFGI